MKTRKEKIIWIFYACILVLLFLLSSTDLIIKERKTEVYPISVIIEDAKDDYYVNFKKGMDQAAEELNADVSFITLYENGNLKQQQDMIVREQQDGARALVVVPVEEKALSDMLAENRLNGPLVLYKAALSGDKVSATVSTDYYAMGQTLAQQVVKDQPLDQPVYLFGRAGGDEVSKQVEDGLLSTFEEAGYHTILYRQQEGDLFRQTIEELVYPGSQKVVIVALDPESLTETAGILSDSSVYASYVSGLYGRGTTIPILNYLDRGIITGVCVTDEFGAGYLTIKKAVEAVTGRGVQEHVVLDSYYIRRDDIRRPEYEKMLYPVE